MEFPIAATFTASRARLSGDEQKAVKTTAFDLQVEPSNPGMSFHNLDKAKDTRTSGPYGEEESLLHVSRATMGYMIYLTARGTSAKRIHFSLPSALRISSS